MKFRIKTDGFGISVQYSNFGIFWVDYIDPVKHWKDVTYFDTEADAEKCIDEIIKFNSWVEQAALKEKEKKKIKATYRGYP